MSEVRLIVREADRDWSGTIHGSAADRAIAALSADPVTLPELEAACARFAKPTHHGPYFANLSPGLNDEPYDAGIVVIDLAARLVAVDSTYSSTGRTGAVSYHDGKCATDTWLRYHIADEWLLIGDALLWPARAAERRRESAARPALDARAVLYGQPLLEFIARGTFARFVRRRAACPPLAEQAPERSHRQADAEVIDDALRQIHADWLLTPREDLGGACPREVALEQHDHITWDLQHQCEWWSLLRKCPPGLEPTSFAFRNGGFGTHELVMYYGLVRALLWSCWDRLTALATRQSSAAGLEALTVGDFLTGEVPRLERVRERWLDTPDAEFRGRTPRSIIDRERARLPEGMSGHHGIVDPDCPCCQMMADLPGPMFWHLDASGMDDGFAFDVHHRTREEWEAEQRRWEESFRRFKAEAEERRRLGVPDSRWGVPDDQPVSSTSVSDADASNTPLVVRLFVIGGQLAEIIVALRERAATPDTQQLIDRLNRDFGNLREIVRSAAPNLADTLLQPVIDRFGESVAAAASTCPHLSPQCDSLAGRIRRFLDPDTSGPGWDSNDLEIPF